MGHVNPRLVGVSGSYPVLERKKFEVPTTSIQFANLVGDTASLYRIEGFIVSEVPLAAFLPHLTINNDSSGVDGIDGNYRELVVDLDSAYLAVPAADQVEFFWGGTSYQAGHVAMVTIEISARSGHGSHIIRAETHNPDATNGKTQLVTGSWDVPDKITSIEITSGVLAPFSSSTFSGDLQLSYMG